MRVEASFEGFFCFVGTVCLRGEGLKIRETSYLQICGSWVTSRFGEIWLVVTTISRLLLVFRVNWLKIAFSRLKPAAQLLFMALVYWMATNERIFKSLPLIKSYSNARKIKIWQIALAKSTRLQQQCPIKLLKDQLKSKNSCKLHQSHHCQLRTLTSSITKHLKPSDPKHSPD